MVARIYKPAKTSMQSGQAKTKRWCLEFAAESASRPEPLMGWSSSADTQKQVRMWFASREEAEAYAQRLGIAYDLLEPKMSETKTLSYSDNFKFDRVGQWTH